MNEDATTELNAELGELLRFYRLSAGKSEEDIAEAAHVSKAKVSGSELGKEPLSVASFYRICGALEVSPSELLAQLEERVNEDPILRRDDSSTLKFMASNRGRQLIRAWSQCDDPRILDAFTNLFLATSLQNKTEKTGMRRTASVSN